MPMYTLLVMIERRQAAIFRAKLLWTGECQVPLTLSIRWLDVSLPHPLTPHLMSATLTYTQNGSPDQRAQRTSQKG